MAVRNPNVSGAPRRDVIAIAPSLTHEVEPKHDVREKWLDVVNTRAEKGVHDDPIAGADFDIAAWFAMDDEAAHERCMTECWYG